MDQHPIPQNVTGFQFKLIGKMTVKQFGYVALGVIAAVIVYYLPISGILGVLIKIIFLPLFGASGAIIAFVPIDGRPIDAMAGNFMKAFFSPNQYVYHKIGVPFSFSKIKPAPISSSTSKHVTTSKANINPQATSKAEALQKLLIHSYAQKTKGPQDAKEEAFLQSLSQATPAQSASHPPQSQPQQEILHKTPPAQQSTPANPIVPNKEAKSGALTEKENQLKEQLNLAKQKEVEGQNQQGSAELHQKTEALEKQLSEIHAQKQALEQEIVALRKQLLVQKTPPPQISSSAKEPIKEEKNKAHVRSIPAGMNKKMGLLVSDTPNVVSGVVKDPRGNVLPNILVEIKDKANNPVRAFKTNPLGNFASATPLAPGEYVITLEDQKKQQTFDEIKITLTNQIFLPLEIISYDKREQLRKELFT